MSFTLHWNEQTFAGVTVRRGLSPGVSIRDAGVEMTARDGGFGGVTTFGRTALSVPVHIQGATRAEYLGRVDALLRGLNTRDAGELWFDAQNDRFWLARLTDVGTREWSGVAAENRTLGFTADDPFAFARTASSLVVTVTGAQQSFTLTSNGSAEAWPVFEVLPGAASAGLVVLENELRGERLAWGQSLPSGKKLRIDCGRQVVEISDDDQDDWVSSMLKVDGVFPAITPGANDLVVYGLGTGATVTASWRDRFI